MGSARAHLHIHVLPRPRAVFKSSGGANAPGRLVIRRHRSARPGTPPALRARARERSFCLPRERATRVQALAWMLFLPTATHRTAAIEVVLWTRQHRFRVNDCYKGWAATLGVRYWRIRSAASFCPVRSFGRRGANPMHLLNDCNVTIDADELLRTVGSAAHWVANG